METTLIDALKDKITGAKNLDELRLSLIYADEIQRIAAEEHDDTMYQSCRHMIDRLLSELPKFSGNEPSDTSGIFSWDDERILIHDSSCGGWIFESRN